MAGTRAGWDCAEAGGGAVEADGQGGVLFGKELVEGAEGACLPGFDFNGDDEVIQGVEVVEFGIGTLGLASPVVEFG